jgi:hypothetical protein
MQQRCLCGRTRSSRLAGALLHLVVADDIQHDCCTSAEMVRLLTAGRHMGVRGCFIIWHTLFPSVRHSKTLSQNCHAYVLMKSARLVHQVAVLGTQLGFKGALLKSAYMKATAKPWSHLLIDLTDRACCDRRLAVRTNCLLTNPDPVVCYGVD